MDPSFYARQVGELPAGISAATHYLRHGWREGRQPHPLFDAAFYQQTCIQAGLGAPKGPPLLHYCRRGAPAGVLCSPLFEPSWWTLQRRKLHSKEAPCLSAVHPLGAVALKLGQQETAQAAALLQRWQSHGLNSADLQQINLLVPSLQPATPIPSSHRVVLLNASPLHWSSHAWLQQLPVGSLEQLEDLLKPEPQPNSYAPTTILLTPQALDQAISMETLLHWWAHARGTGQLIVMDRCLGALLQAMGLEQVELLEAGLTTNHWLKDEALLHQAEQQLGLPMPEGLTARQPIVLGDAGASWQASLSDRLLAFPGWEHLIIRSSAQARAQAAWLNRCAQLGHALVLLNPEATDQARAALSALQAKALILQGSFSESSLLEELSWHQQGCPDPQLNQTPQPEHQVLWHHNIPTMGSPKVSVCISLHNYGHTIERALTSVRAQTLAGIQIELLVVDDASSDSGAASVQAWMDNHGRQFHSCRLLQHARNGGLASARNTAFMQAQAAWCFVLDADNLLHPSALEASLAVADHSGEKTAVVHPWIALEVEQSNSHRNRLGLHGIAHWQRERFLHGNHIDAMALVRRSAWASVGGYSHIPGGWEDFDFWCCLIEAGWHGVCLPQTVCSYVVHHGSMLATQTNTNLRQLSRLLQHRHPWLELKLHSLDPQGGAHRR